MIERVQSAVAAIGQQQQHSAQSTAPKTGFTELMRQVQDGSPKAPATPQQAAQQEQSVESVINFSKHAMSRAQERGIELTPDLMEKLSGSVEKAQEKGAKNILAFNATQAFIINVPYGRVITTMNQDEMKENIFTNIDGAVLI
ncbi:TIGR02530 family flagellar biosynthesis protein [Acutalibacter muris]|uniref:TIGR02530 family flagellar biosynthesis protein n=1 Tax=Acutalibacter muris TaxID=1796620 RepID=UPI00272AB019|nr:TIGR02530 family flagellar biosynthesis protein [Acutalibacter muris]MCI9192081.1 flagellar biosynthesis protein [Acutalibacter muris]